MNGFRFRINEYFSMSLQLKALKNDNIVIFAEKLYTVTVFLLFIGVVQKSIDFI